MNTRRHILGSTQGFTLVETVAAVALITVVAYMGSRTLLDSNHTILGLRRQKQAATLGEMVLQQYKAYASQSFQILDTVYSVTNQTPQQFFNKADNFGYDGFLITTRANYAQNRSTCAVSVALSWQEGGQAKSATYTKTFSQSNHSAGGGAVQVYLKMSCGTYTLPQDIINNCPGLPGLGLSAPPGTPGNPTVFGTTDSNGQALLKNVLLGNSVALQITAPITGPSYYAMNGGNYVSTLTKQIQVVQANLNLIVVTDFKPTGQIKGRVVNDDTINANPPINNLQVTLAGNAVMMNTMGTFVPCATSTSTCVALTSTTGYYEFDNVIPTADFNLIGTGRAGSNPDFEPTNPNFVQGYTNPNPEYVASSAWNGAPLSGPSGLTPIVSPLDLHVQAMGGATLTAIDALTNQPLPYVQFYVQYPPTPFPAYPAQWLPNITGPNGVISLYNVFANNNNVGLSGLVVEGRRAPQPGDHGLYGSTQYFSCSSNCLGGMVPYQFLLNHQYQLNGQFQDDSSPSLFATGQANIYGRGDPMIAPDGTFSVNQYSFPGGVNDPTQPFSDNIAVINPFWTQQTYSLRIHDQDGSDGWPAVHAANTFWAPINTPNQNMVYTSDANGDYTYSGSFQYWNSYPFNAQCENTTFTCSMCPFSNPASPCPVVTPIHINSQTITYNMGDTTGMHGWVHYGQQLNPQQAIPGTPPTFNVPNRLKDVMVQGTITGIGNQPLTGIQVLDVNNAVVAVTDSNGAYSGWAAVTGGDATQSGHVQIMIPAGQVVGGTSYSAGGSGPIQLTNPVDPLAPTTSNLQLQPQALSGGGGV
jgi:type II secretory pathway pseudopilin PulG